MVDIPRTQAGKLVPLNHIKHRPRARQVVDKGTGTLGGRLGCATSGGVPRLVTPLRPLWDGFEMEVEQGSQAFSEAQSNSKDTHTKTFWNNKHLLPRLKGSSSR